ncbi:MAG: hypothetical protein H6974_12240 [Gammaproteobacteria bacterium]|nr:hypothetical protein [Gammaproteobacteria bacterium]
MSDLSTELKTYQRLLPTLLAHQGKFVVIAGDQLLDVFVAYEDALKAAYARFGMQPFLVKRISADEQVSYFTRDLNTACPA